MTKYIECNASYWTEGEKYRSSFFLFMIGLGAATQVVLIGTIGISEIIVLLISPFVLYKDWRMLRHDGFVPLIALCATSMVSLCVSCLWNHNFYPIMIIKQWAILYSIVAFVVVYHRLLRGNLRGIRWFLLGYLISTIIKAFAFNPTVTVGTTGSVEVLDIETLSSFSSPIFWAEKFRQGVTLISGGWYMQVPSGITIFLCCAASGFVALTSVSGRSAMATLLVASFLHLLGGKTADSLRRLCKHFWLLCVGMILVVLVIKNVYAYAAVNGILGDDAYNKYEKQTKTGTSLAKLLIAGRMEFFIGLRACIDRPVLGYGILPIDDNDYTRQMYYKYGSHEDYEVLDRYYRQKLAGLPVIIPGHSYITLFWLLCGLPGCFCGYIVFT